MMCNKQCEGGKCAGGSCGTKKCHGGMIAKILILIGGLNWGLIGIGGFIGVDLNVVHLILGGLPVLEWIVYILVGLAAVMKMFGCHCAMCKKGGMSDVSAPTKEGMSEQNM